MNFFKRQFLTNPLWFLIYAITVLTFGPQLISAASWIAFGLGVLLFVLLFYWLYKAIQYIIINNMKETHEEHS